MSKLVVNQIQYSGGATYTLPTANPSANDQLKTDGSGALGWTSSLSAIKNASNGQVTNMPAQAGSSGQVLQSNGAGTLVYGSAPSNPMKVGSTYGYYLADRYEVLTDGTSTNFLMSAGGSGQPGSATPFGNNTDYPIGYYFTWVGLGISSTGTYRIQAQNQSGNDVGGSYSQNVYYNGIYNENQGLGNTSTSYNSYINLNRTALQNSWGSSTIQFTDSGSTTRYGKASLGEMWIFPGLSYPQYNYWMNYSNSGNSSYKTTQLHMWMQNMMQSTGQGYEYFSDLPWQFEWQLPNGQNWNEGVCELYVLMSDNGSYPG